MRGKYSPTVSMAYRMDQEWHRTYASGEAYDPDGFDAYGYNKDDIDRAGNAEYDYYSNDCPPEYNDDFNDAYDNAEDAWEFDGERPVLKENL